MIQDRETHPPCRSTKTPGDSQMTQGAADRSMWDLARHTLVYGTGYVTMALAGLVLVPVYTHRFSPAAYGLLGLMLVLYGVMRPVYDLGFTYSVGRFFFGSDGEARETALRRVGATSIAFLAGFGGALTLLLWLPAREWSSVLTSRLRMLIW